MKRKLMAAALAAFGLLIMASVPASAHHSFSAEFDGKREVVLDGKVSKMDWVNPHAWLYIDVPKPDGTIEKWSVEFGSPNVLFRSGWNKQSLPEGIRVIVRGFPAKDGSRRANSRSVQFPDGRKLDTGSSFGKDGK